MLADGMGGLNAGDVASRVAVDAALDFLSSGAGRDESDVAEAIVAANELVRKRAIADAQFGNMGTTLVVWTWLTDGQCVVGHVGDSRAYQLAGGVLTRVTRDHSVVQQLLDDGLIDARLAETSPNRHIITQAVGLEDVVDPALSTLRFDVSDTFLLCSDGLTDLVQDVQIEKMLNAGGSLDERAERLVEAALANGGLDNISVVLIEFGGQP